MKRGTDRDAAARRHEVMLLVADGVASTEIASRLGITRQFVNRIKAKAPACKVTPGALSRLKASHPKAFRALELVDIVGMSDSGAAVKMGCSRPTLRYHVDVARAILAGRNPFASPIDKAKDTAHEEKLSALGRCTRCELLLPCVCLPNISDLASARGGPGDVLPEGGW